MSIIQFAHRLQLNNYLSIANEISLVCLFQVLAFVSYGKQFLSFEWNTSQLELFFKSLLINSLQESMSQLVVNFHCCTIDGIAFLIVY